jgi:DNA-binding MarR family transcriptional regulator
MINNEKIRRFQNGKIYKLSTNGLELINAHLCESNNNLEQLVKRLDKEEQKEFLDAMVTMIKILKKL